MLLLQHQQPKLLQINKLIAGNIYISAGGRGKSSSKFLMELLHAIQEECSRIRQQQQQQHADNRVVLVHAFADPCYDRSSLHLAGNSCAVAQVTTWISRLALQHNNNNTCFTTSTDTTVPPPPTAHPNVGFIDHIALMPLLLPHNTAVSTFLSHFSNHQSDPTKQQQDSCTQAAKYVGEYLSSEMGCIVHYYGSASIDHAPLAKVRRERTNFFQSGALAASKALSIGSSSSPDTPSSSSSNTVVCVGSPCNFVENFNIRLSVTENKNNNNNNNNNSNATVGKKVAISLCRTLRERDGGLLGVEALTLPYLSSSPTTNNSCWEVECNLLSPHVGSKDAIRQRTMEWLTQYNNSENTNLNVISIEDMYSVGTTQEQCLNVLLLLLRKDVEEVAIHKHDENVANNFFSYLHTDMGTTFK
jgi:hypothetical protein